MSFYKKELMDHYKNPRNYGILNDFNFKSDTLNPSCGDEISLQAIIKNNVMQNITFQGKGCIISQASASLFTEYCKNKSLNELQKITSDDMISLVGLSLGPTRLKCVLLVLEALKKGLNNFSNENA